jgi:hypothetical protein
MERQVQFVERQSWPRFTTWPMITVGGIAVAAFAFDELAWPLRAISQTLAIVSIPLLCLLLEWMGPIVEVVQGIVSYEIWPFYRKEIDLSQMKSCTTRTFHPPGNDVTYRTRGYRRVPETHYVELWLTDGRVIDLTTNHPERLAEAIRRESNLAKQQDWREGAILV